MWTKILLKSEVVTLFNINSQIPKRRMSEWLSVSSADPDETTLTQTFCIFSVLNKTSFVQIFVTDQTWKINLNPVQIIEASKVWQFHRIFMIPRQKQLI